jgi:hypothetical protein
MDGWKGYYSLIININYQYRWINHSNSFENKEGYNSNTIEGTFNGIKCNFPVRKHAKGLL